MIQQDNLIIADNNKCLKTPNGICNMVPLGTSIYYENGLKKEINISLKDIQEGITVRILDDIYFVSSTNYENIVSELIRYKYTLDLELALYANSFIKDNSEKMKEYQLWRELCKQAAKKIYNE